jgi:hypothetical protein
MVPAGVVVVSVGYHRVGFSPQPKTVTSHVAQPETTGEDAGTDAWHHHREERRYIGLTVDEEGRRSLLASPPTSMGSG